jgi:glutathione S-transferase
MAIKLYDLAAAEDDRRFSPYCWRSKMALKHKGLDFETIPWRFTEKEALAPYQSTTVPVLVDGNQSVYDSWAIALYLDEVYPSRPRLFGSTESRTLCDFFNQWTMKALHPLIMRMVVLDLFEKVHPKDKAYFRESREQRYGMSLEEFSASLSAHATSRAERAYMRSIAYSFLADQYFAAADAALARKWYRAALRERPGDFKTRLKLLRPARVAAAQP